LGERERGGSTTKGQENPGLANNRRRLWGERSLKKVIFPYQTPVTKKVSGCTEKRKENTSGYVSGLAAPVGGPPGAHVGRGQHKGAHLMRSEGDWP